MQGAYDDGYERCPCFWGRKPARLVQKAAELLSSGKGKTLDVGCGDGKNASFLESLGFDVLAFDASPLAISNARNAWPQSKNITWLVADLLTYEYGVCIYDLVVATGPLHCLATSDDVISSLRKIQMATRLGGYNVISVFNDRQQDFSGHKRSFSPILLSHSLFVDAYSQWKILEASDEDLVDEHPHTKTPHQHSITRLLTQRLL